MFELLKKASFPNALMALGADEIRQIWHSAKQRGGILRFNEAKEIWKWSEFAKKMQLLIVIACKIL